MKRASRGTICTAATVDVVMMMRSLRPAIWALTLAIAALPVAVPAQSAAGEETIAGRIASIDAAGNMDLNDDRGWIDSVQLGQATTVDPPGARLVPGMMVTIAGVNRGSVFAADRVSIAGADSAPQQTPPPQPARVGLPPQLRATGELTGYLGNALDSKSAAIGQPVELADVSSADGSIRHALMSGTVSDVVHPGQGRNAQIELHIDQLQLRDGTTYRVDGVVTTMHVATKNNTLKEFGGALAGMLVGNAIEKSVFGASGGGIAGAIGGYFIAKDNRTDVVIPDDTAISVRLVSARRQSP